MKEAASGRWLALGLVCAALLLCTQAEEIQKASGAAPAAGSTPPASVVYYEPELSLQYAEHIHPYAWEHARPTPFYQNHHNAYNIADEKELGSFLEVQTHIKAHSREAARLTVKAKEHETGIWNTLMSLLKPNPKDPANLNFDLNPKGWSAIMGRKPVDNAASLKIDPKMKPVPSDFNYDPNKYRRAVYGLRRRRLPYFVNTGPFGSINPWRRQNSFFNGPRDFLAEKLPNPRQAIANPRYFDFGRIRMKENLAPFGGYSSFSDIGSSSSGSSGSGSSSGGGGLGPRVFRHVEYPFRSSFAPFPAPRAQTPYSDGYSNVFMTGLRDASNRAATGAYGPDFSPNLGAVPNYIPGDDHFFDFYAGLHDAGGGGGGESSGSGSE